MTKHLETAAIAAAFLAAIAIANLLTAHDPAWAIPNAGLLIGFDLAARDRLHDRWIRHRPLKLTALAIAGAAIAYAINADAGTVAQASAIAIALAFAGDALVYQALRNRPWLERTNWSNLPAAAIDSAVFPLLAFGHLDARLAVGILLAKVGGGALWALLLQPRAEPAAAR